MHVVAFLPPPLLSHLRVVLHRDHTVHEADDWAAVDAIIRQRPVEVAVLDPLGVRGDHVSHIIALLHRHPGLPVMLYTTLSPPTLKAVSELARHGAPHVTLHRFDDEPARFREAIQRLPDQGLGDLVLEGIGPALALIPTSLALAIERLFRSPELIRDTRALAQAAGLNVRTIYRQLEGAGLASPRTLIVGARLLRAYSYLRDPGQSVESISLLLGYTEPRIFARNAREAFGLTPTALRHGMDSAQFVKKLIAFIHPSPDLYAGESSPDLGSPLVS